MKYLELRTIKSTTEDDYSWFVKVAVIDKAIGVTLTFNDERYPNIIGDESFCLNGPLSPYYKHFCDTYPLYKEKYPIMFDMLIEQIKLGEIDIKSFYDMLQIPIKYGSVACPYR